MKQETIDKLKATVRNIPDFPIKGIQFKDLTTTLKDGEALAIIADELEALYAGKGVTKVVGIESRGFIGGAILAARLGAGFVPVRKPGKLPAITLKKSYSKEYGVDTIEVHKDAITPNDVVVLHHKLFPVYYQIWFWFKFFTKCNIEDSRPDKYMKDFDLPVLFMWGTKDVYCLPEKSQILYDLCASKNKEIAWFEGAEHSRVRLFDENRYDAIVKDFLARN